LKGCADVGNAVRSVWADKSNVRTTMVFLHYSGWFLKSVDEVCASAVTQPAMEGEK
jgi:hypothetical protein